MKMKKTKHETTTSNMQRSTVRPVCTQRLRGVAGGDPGDGTFQAMAGGTGE